jgi:hypothetical protein
MFQRPSAIGSNGQRRVRDSPGRRARGIQIEPPKADPRAAHSSISSLNLGARFARSG